MQVTPPVSEPEVIVMPNPPSSSNTEQVLNQTDRISQPERVPFSSHYVPPQQNLNRLSDPPQVNYQPQI